MKELVGKQGDKWILMRTRDEIKDLIKMIENKRDILQTNNTMSESRNNTLNINKYTEQIEFLNKTIENYDLYKWFLTEEEEVAGEILRTKRYAAT